MSWASDLPQELLCRPMGLVVLTGLDLVYNAVHQAIWDSFCNNRGTNRVPLQFRPLPGDHEYPKCRQKRTSYDWYIPKGILRTSWMKKHLEQIPAVVVIFFDLDWDEVQWKEKQMECSTRVEILRNSLEGRNTKVCVVLIQKNAPLPPGEDMMAGERANALCSACELSAKSLFVLPLTDHLKGYTIRLENAFYELAQGYYHVEARKVKSHRDFLNKTTHQLLFVRHQFKIAFYNELKQDLHTAIKHYKQAYLHLLEVRMVDTSLLETKTIAGFISYKHSQPLDAISQFRKLIDTFKSKVGMQDIAFEHSAWLARQFQAFGDLFDEAIKMGLTAIQTQHPGIYYQQAAYQLIQRKQLCQALCRSPDETFHSDALDNLYKLDYYGQRPWRQGQLSIEPPDAVKEKEGILALQHLELKVDHSRIIIPMLGSAVAQFKKYKSARMKQHLMVQLGEEYYHARDYAKALTLLSRVTWEYRHEHWWMLLTSVVNTQLKCAYLVGSVQEYITNCLELAGKYTTNSADEKRRIHSNFQKVIAGELPEPEPWCNSESVEAAKNFWNQLFTAAGPTPVTAALAARDEGPATEAAAAVPTLLPVDAATVGSDHQKITLEMSNLAAFVECRAQFVRDVFAADEFVVISVHLRSTAPFEVNFSKLCINLSRDVYDEHCVLISNRSHDKSGSGQVGDLCLTPDLIMTHSFSFLPHADDVGKVLEITSVSLELAPNPSKLTTVLHWNGAGTPDIVNSVSLTMSQGHLVRGQRSRSSISGSSDLKNEKQPWQNVVPNPFARVKARAALLDLCVEHSAPALINELHAFSVSISNNELSQISNIVMTFGLKENDASPVNQSTGIYETLNDVGGELVHKHQVNILPLDSKQKIERKFFTRSTLSGDFTLVINVSYDVKVAASGGGGSGGEVSCRCAAEQEVQVNVTSALSLDVSLCSLKFESLESVNRDEPFLVQIDLTCHSPSPLVFHSSSLALTEGVRTGDEEDGGEALKDFQSQLSGVCLKKDETAGQCISLIVRPAANQTSADLGQYVVHFRRKEDAASDTTSPLISVTVGMPTVTVETLPVYVTVDLPAYGSVLGAGLTAVYHVYNRTDLVQEVDSSIESSDSFMFSGLRQVRFRVLPHGEHVLTYKLVPLVPGNVRLPVLNLNLARYPESVTAAVHKMLPSEIFVKAPGKGLLIKSKNTLNITQMQKFIDKFTECVLKSWVERDFKLTD